MHCSKKKANRGVISPSGLFSLKLNRNLIFEKLKLYSYFKCSSCRKAINWLRLKELDFDLIDIMENPPSRGILLDAANNLGDRKYLFNTSGISYRELGAKVIKGYTNEKAFDALEADPKLIKRPFLVVNKNKFLVGFNESKWSATLLS